VGGRCQWTGSTRRDTRPGRRTRGRGRNGLASQAAAPAGSRPSSHRQGSWTPPTTSTPQTGPPRQEPRETVSRPHGSNGCHSLTCPDSSSNVRSCHRRRSRRCCSASTDGRRSGNIPKRLLSAAPKKTRFPRGYLLRRAPGRCLTSTVAAAVVKRITQSVAGHPLRQRVRVAEDAQPDIVRGRISELSRKQQG
jgi:hypothetical protein